MGLEVKVLDLGDIELDTSFLVLALEPGQAQQVPTLGFLITGGEAPIVVDTGFSDPSIMGNLGMTGWWRDEQGMEKQLAKHGLEMKDVRYVLHTHLHIDHAGYDDQFPMDGTTVVINRRELEYSVSGLMGEQYPAPYIKHLVDRLHHPGRAAAARPRGRRLRGDHPRRALRGRRRPHRGLDEHPRRHRRGRGLHLRRRHLRHRPPARRPAPAASWSSTPR